MENNSIYKIISVVKKLIPEEQEATFNRILLEASIAGIFKGLGLLSLLLAAVVFDETSRASFIHPAVVIGSAIVIAIISFIFLYLYLVKGMKFAVSLIRSIHTVLGDKISTLPIGWFNSSIAGKLSVVVTKGVLSLGSAIAHGLFVLAQDIVATIVIIIGFFFFDITLGIAFAISIAVFALITYFFSDISHKNKVKSVNPEAEVADRIVEFAKSQKALRAAGVGSDFAPLQKARDEYFDIKKRTYFQESTLLAIKGSISQIISITLIVVSIQRFIDGHLSGVETIIAIGFALILHSLLADLTNGLAMVQESVQALEVSDEIMKTESLSEVDESKEQTAPGEVELDNVTFSYTPDKTVLKNVSFKVPAHTMTALVGPSGSGKSTILRLISRFYEVDNGTVLVGGVPVKDLTTEDLMKNISIVFQDVYLFDDTLKENIRVGRPSASDEEIIEAARLAGVSEIVERLPKGYETQVGEGGTKLSGGERQRVSIARAILKEAPIVLLDEATSALDVENEEQIVASMKYLREKSTVIVIAHKLSTIEVADQIVVLDKNGEVSQVGSHDELVETGGIYRSFWESRNEAEGWTLV